ncbi:proteasome assembly chaperone family protein [Nocardioides bruguierae]|uniref:PAC2 family protein n=1 Tax=Nocardioides bruguierae TaxID=2945102 RepID=A0A9X2D430_9ACTN|nr:PAC2 family protein [Nocardioides bruguierae]MCM0618843.1 PAC2 family protein [Nocardioides bruguierae]
MAEDRLVHILDEVPELDERPEGSDLTLVMHLDGFLDAGNAARRAVQHLLDVADDSPVTGLGGADLAGAGTPRPTGWRPGKVVATFDVDELHDYRARRPPVTFAVDHYEAYDAPRLVVRLLHDSGGNPYLLLHGPEPDVRWEAFVRAVRRVVERFEVTRVVSLGAVPMAAPHTRPLAMTHHANDAALLLGTSPWSGQLRVPASAQALVEIRLGESGHAALGFVAHVPHYLAQLDYPRAATALLEQVERAARLTIDLSGLVAESEDRDAEIASYLEANDDVADVVTALEQQYDTFERAETSGEGLLAEDEPLPSGDELGRQFEQFLADLDNGGTDPGAGDGEGEGPPESGWGSPQG